MNYREAWTNGEIEAGTLVDRIEEQAREIERLNAVGLANEKLAQRIKELKVQQGGVVLPEKYDDGTTYGQGRDDAVDEVARLNQPASAGDPAKAEPIQVEAVAVTREDGDVELYLDWLLEGGISALEKAGLVLVVAHGKITDDEGSGTVYTQARAALSANHSEQVREGWKLVPVEPTSEIYAAAKGSGVLDPRVSGFCYSLMLAAAPSAGSQKEKE